MSVTPEPAPPGRLPYVPPTIDQLHARYKELGAQVTADPDNADLRKAKREAHAAYWSLLHP